MGTIIKTAKKFTETSGKILLNATNGDVVFNSSKGIVYSAKEAIEMGDYEKIDPNKKIISAIWVDAKTTEVIKEASIGQELNILVRTLNYEEGESISLTIEDTIVINGDEKIEEVEYVGKVNDKGMAILEDKILIE